MMVGYYIKENKSYTNWSEKDMDERRKWSNQSENDNDDVRDAIKQWSTKYENKNKLKESISKEVIRIQSEIPHSKSLDPKQIQKYTEMAYKVIMFLLKLWIQNA